MWKALLIWAIRVIDSYASIRSLRGPLPKPADAPSTEFSARRAMLHVQQIASAPHPVGSAQHDRVREYIVEELTRLNTAPQELSSTGLNRSGGEVSAAPVTNIVGHIAGSASTGAVLLSAHYDSVE